ncbi:MAG: hypothetical protein V3V85_00020 [Candidatus Thorarchaeota archaeon]
MLSYGFNDSGLSCPNCGATNIYSAEAIDSEGFVDCQNCGSRFRAHESIERVETSITPGPVGTEFYHYTEAPKKSSNAGLWCIIVFIFLFAPVIIAIPSIICILYFKREQLFGGGKSSGPKRPKRPDTW